MSLPDTIEFKVSSFNKGEEIFGGDIFGGTPLSSLRKGQRLQIWWTLSHCPTKVLIQLGGDKKYYKKCEGSEGFCMGDSSEITHKYVAIDEQTYRNLP